MKRAGAMMFPLLVDNLQHVGRNLFLFDEFWVPGLQDGLAQGPEYPDQEPAFATIQWLAEQGLVKVPPKELEAGRYEADPVTEVFGKHLKRVEKGYDRTYATAEAAARGAVANLFNHDILLGRLFSYVSWRDGLARCYPVLFPLEPGEGPDVVLGSRQAVLDVVLRKFPVPGDEVSLEDLVRLKQDPKTRHSLETLWSWIRNAAKHGLEGPDAEEEAESLLEQYEHSLGKLRQKRRYEVLRVAVSTPGDVLEDFAKLRWGKLAGRIIEFKQGQIAAADEEMKAPGNEMAYVYEANRLARRK